MSAKATDIKRKHIRFAPDRPTTAWLCFENLNQKDKFKGQLIGLVRNESLMGCGLVCLEEKRSFTKGEEVLIKVGDLHPMRSKLMWIKSYGSGVFELGIEYLEGIKS
jgi:hypothetical protein